MTVTKSSRHSFAPRRMQYEEAAGLAFTKTERNYFRILSEGSDFDIDEPAQTARSHIRDNIAHVWGLKQEVDL